MKFCRQCLRHWRHGSGKRGGEQRSAKQRHTHAGGARSGDEQPVSLVARAICGRGRLCDSGRIRRIEGQRPCVLRQGAGCSAERAARSAPRRKGNRFRQHKKRARKVPT